MGNTRTKMHALKSRKWCLTLNNYTENELEQWNSYFEKKKNCLKYLIGKEIGKENNTPHLQMWARFKNPITFNSLKKISNRVHLEECKGSDIKNIEYCSKEGNVYGSKNIEIKENNNENLDVWLKHLERHRNRGTTCGLLWILETLDLMERHDIDTEDRENYEYYTDIRDEMLNCGYCLLEREKELDDRRNSL